MIEEWRDVVGYEGLYMVSNLGNVKQLPRDVTVGYGAIIHFEEKLKKLHKKNNGYMATHLTKDGKTITAYVHRLVAEAFIPNPQNKKDVNHKDYNRGNNILDNLEWATRSENNLWSSERISKSRKSNNNEHHIKKVMRSNDRVSYKVEFQVNKKRIYKYFKKLEDAIAYRDNLLNYFMKGENNGKTDNL